MSAWALAAGAGDAADGGFEAAGGMDEDIGPFVGFVELQRGPASRIRVIVANLSPS
jgi:hypothetical protein